MRLEPFHRRLFYIVFGVLWGSGRLWLLIEWFKDPELGAARTLLQTISMKVHGATMLVYVALLGTLIAHIRRGTALKANRLSGFTMIALNGVLALSGWLLYYVSDDALREFSSTIPLDDRSDRSAITLRPYSGRAGLEQPSCLTVKTRRPVPAEGWRIETKSSAAIAPERLRLLAATSTQA